MLIRTGVMMAHAVTRQERSSAELRREAKRCGDGRVACRILAIAHVLDGMSRTDAARSCGMDRQTLRDWVHRYNAEGIAGLADAPRGGRPPALSSEQMAELRGLVLAGPDPARDGVVRRQASAPAGAVASAAASAQSQARSRCAGDF
jgi:transposase-like protein